MYQIKRDSWEGPFTILYIDQYGICLLQRRIPSKFCLAVVKPCTFSGSKGSTSDSPNLVTRRKGSPQPAGLNTILVCSDDVNHNDWGSPEKSTMTAHFIHSSCNESEPAFHALRLVQSSDHKRYGYSEHVEIFELPKTRRVLFCSAFHGQRISPFQKSLLWLYEGLRVTYQVLKVTICSDGLKQYRPRIHHWFSHYATLFSGLTSHPDSMRYALKPFLSQYHPGMLWVNKQSWSPLLCRALQCPAGSKRIFHSTRAFTL